MTEIKSLDLGMREAVSERLAKYPPEISDHTFTNLFIWRKSRPIQIIDSGDALIFVATRKGHASVFGPPVGSMEPGLARSLALEVSGLPSVAFERLPQGFATAALNSGIEVHEDRDNFDYVYRREDLAGLEGRRYHPKRNLIAQCLASYNPTYEEIGPANLGEVSEMMDAWCKSRRCGHDPGLCDEYIAVQELLSNYSSLGATGAAVRIDGRIVAFTVGEKLNGKTAVIHFEKAMPGYKGLYQLINNLFAKNHLGGFEFVNREQDLGMEGLRRAKESYFPDHLVKKHSTALPPETKLNRCRE